MDILFRLDDLVEDFDDDTRPRGDGVRVDHFALDAHEITNVNRLAKHDLVYFKQSWICTCEGITRRQRQIKRAMHLYSTRGEQD